MVLNKRQTYILQTIICHPGVTGEELAQNTGISTRTLGADIKTINGMVRSYGLQLENRRGTGFFCDSECSEQFEYMKSQLIRRSYYAFPEENDFSERVGQIIRMLLMDGGFVKMDDIAEALWLTRSSLNQELREVRKIMKRYGLELLTRPHYGLSIIGDEPALRQCMTDFCKPYFHSLDYIPFLEDGYSHYGIEFSKVKLFHSHLLQTIADNQLRTSDQALQRLINQLLVMEIRIGNGKNVAVSEELSAAVNGSVAYSTAEMILKNTLGALSRDETTYFALVLLMNADFYHTPGYMLKECGFLYTNAILLHDKLQDYFREQLHIVFSGDAQFSHALLKLLLQFVIRKELGVREFEYAGPAYELAARLPVSRQLACESLLYLKELTGYYGDQYLIINFTLLFYNTVMSIPSNRKKLKMLCVGPHNLYFSRSIGYKIKSQHYNYVDSIEFCTAYELPSMDLRKYDYILTSEPPEVLPEQNTLPVLELKYFLDWKDLYDFRNRVVLPQISTETLFHNMTQLAFDQVIDCNNLEEFITWACGSQEMVPFHELLPILPSDGTIALYCSFTLPGNAWSTKLIKLSEPIKHGLRTIPYAVICSIPLNFETNVLKLSDSLLRRILLDTDRILSVPQ